MKEAKVVILFLFFLLFTQWGISQKSAFFREAEAVFHIKDSISEIEKTNCTETDYVFQQIGMGDLEQKLLSRLKKEGRACKDDVRQSKTLSIMAHLAINTWKGDYFSSADKWFKLNRYFNRVSRMNEKPFHEINSTSCRIKLVNNRGKKFFYFNDKNAPNDINLFFGKKPTKREIDEGFVLEKLPLYTDEQLLEQIIKELRRSKMFRQLKRGNFSYIGLKIEIDEKSLYKNQLPTARIVVIAGARRQVRTIKLD